MNDRVMFLLARELDGSISDLERAELDRSILLCPNARRERAGWKRVIGSIKEDQPAKRLPIERMAAEIAKQAQERAPLIPFKRMRRVVFATTLAAAALALFTLRPPEPARTVTREQPAAIARESSPVEMRIEPDARDEEVAVVTIRF